MTFAEWAAGEERFTQHFEALEGDGDLPLDDWLGLAESERRSQVPSIEIGERRLAVSGPMAQAAGERLALWNTLRELTGGSSPFTAQIRETLAAELQAEREAEIGALESEHAARVAEVQAGADQQALDRLTDRLLALSGFDANRPAKSNGG